MYFEPHWHLVSFCPSVHSHSSSETQNQTCVPLSLILLKQLQQ